jgi:hypothetical protein
MRAKFKQDRSVLFSDLTVGNVYRVIGVSGSDLRIMSDEGLPFLYPRDAFELVDEREPADWVVKVGDSGERYMYPPELARPGFFEDYFDDDPKAVAAFRVYMSKICRPVGRGK